MAETQESGLAEPMGPWKWIHNPFHRVAGGSALAVGLVTIVTTAFVGFAGHTHVDGVLDVHPGHGPLWLFLSEGLIDWLAMGILIYLAGLIASRSHIRPLDVFGTQAMARTPMLLAALFSLLPGHQRFTAQLIAGLSGSGPPPSASGDAVAFGVVTLVILVSLVWMVALMYRGFAVACNVSGPRAVVLFIVALVLAEAASKMAIVGLIRVGLAGPAA